MTKTAKKSEDSVTNAVAYLDNLPVWDVSADEVCFPILVEMNYKGKFKEFVLFPALSQHTDRQSKKGFAYENKKVLRATISDMKIRGDEMQFASSDESAIHKFVDLHFTRFHNATISHEEQIAYLNKNSFLKTKIFREGIEGISLKEQDVELVGEGEDIDIFSINFDNPVEEISLTQELFSPEKGRLEEIDITHFWGPATDPDFAAFKKATHQTYNSRKRTFVARENYDVLEQLYNSKVTKVEGMCVGSERCVETNKKNWVDLIPLEHKLVVLELIFRKIRTKNA